MRASANTPARSAAERVKLTTTRSHACTPSRDWMSAIARNVAITSRVAAKGRVDDGDASSARAAASTLECCRTSMDARWKPNVSTCQRRCWSSPARQARGPARVERALQHVQVSEEGRRAVIRPLGPGAGRRQPVRRRARACADAARRAGFVRAHGRRPAAHRRRAPGLGGARGWAARLVPRPTTCARSAARRGLQSAQHVIGLDRPSRHGSPPPSPTGSRPGRLPPRCPNGGTARTTGGRAPQPAASIRRSISR